MLASKKGGMMERFAEELLEILAENHCWIEREYEGDTYFLAAKPEDQAQLAGYLTEALRRVGAAPLLAVLATGITKTSDQAEGSSSPAREPEPESDHDSI